MPRSAASAWLSVTSGERPCSVYVRWVCISMSPGSTVLPDDIDDPCVGGPVGGAGRQHRGDPVAGDDHGAFARGGAGAVEDAAAAEDDRRPARRARRDRNAARDHPSSAAVESSHLLRSAARSCASARRSAKRKEQSAKNSMTRDVTCSAEFRVTSPRCLQLLALRMLLLALCRVCATGVPVAATVPVPGTRPKRREAGNFERRHLAPRVDDERHRSPPLGLVPPDRLERVVVPVPEIAGELGAEPSARAPRPPSPP